MDSSTLTQSLISRLFYNLQVANLYTRYCKVRYLKFDIDGSSTIQEVLYPSHRFMSESSLSVGVVGPLTVLDTR